MTCFFWYRAQPKENVKSSLNLPVIKLISVEYNALFVDRTSDNLYVSVAVKASIRDSIVRFNYVKKVL